MQVILIIILVFILYNRASTKGALDIGFVHLLVVLFSVSSVISVYYSYYINIDHYWVLWSNKDILDRVISNNVIYCASFTLCYILLIKFFDKKKVLPNYNIRNVYFSNLSIHFIVYFIVLFLGYALVVSSNTYLSAYWSNVIDLSKMIVFSLLLSRVNSVRMVFLICFLGVVFIIFIEPLILGDENYIVNRGGAIKVSIAVLVYIHIIGKHNIFTLRRILLGFIALPVILGFAQFVEAVMEVGSEVGWRDLMLYVSSGYELRMMENQAMILDLLQRNEIKLQEGVTYFNAFYDLIFPFENLSESPSAWLAEHLNAGTDSNSKYGFSVVAEGVLNFGEYGGVFAGIISAIVLYSVRLVSQMNSMFGPILYANLFVLSYYVYRSDFAYILKKIEFTFLSALIIFSLYMLVRILFTKPALQKIRD